MTPPPTPPRQDIGTSVQGRAIEIAFFGPPLTGQSRINTLLIGVFHGDEGISGALSKRLMRHLAGQAVERPAAIVPVLNPDGLVAQTRVNANGVDLNRNFPTGNWALEARDSLYYGGPAPGSEPETQALIRLIEDYRPEKIITVHSPYKVLNFDGPGRELAEAMAAHSGYRVVDSIGYPTPGSFGTYAGIERNIPVITLELPPGPDDPPHHDQNLPPEPLEKIWAENAESLMAALRF